MIDGKFIYQGKASMVQKYFEAELGYKFPAFSNPPDFFMSKMHPEKFENRERFPEYFEKYERLQGKSINALIAEKSTDKV